MGTLLCSTLAFAQNTTFQYFYDDLGQLTKVIDSAGNEIDYIYDPLGNLLQIKRVAAPAGTTLAIFGFTPMRGDTGAPVTIQGQAFGTSLGANTVQFNGTPAIVVSATATNLTVLVPDGAATGPISVTVGANTVTSTLDFTIGQVPIITSLSRKSALFNTVVNDLTVTGTNLLGATLSFQTPAIGLITPSPPTNASATLQLSIGATAGTFGLVANSSLGNSSTAITKSNRFTVVDPTSTADSDGDGIPDAIEAEFGTDPLNPTSFPTVGQLVSGGEVESTVVSVLNLQPPLGTVLNGEAESIIFSVLNTKSGTSTSPSAFEADSARFSVLNTDGYPSITTAEADSVIFSVQNAAHSTTSKLQPALKISTPVDTDGDGYPDALEIALGSDPKDPNSIPDIHPPPEADGIVFSIANYARVMSAAVTSPDSLKASSKILLVPGAQNSRGEKP